MQVDWLGWLLAGCWLAGLYGGVLFSKAAGGRKMKKKKRGPFLTE